MKKRLKFTFTIVTENNPENIEMIRTYMTNLQIVFKEYPQVFNASQVTVKEERA